MAQLFWITVALVGLSVTSLSPAAPPPQTPPETQAERALRLAGFTLFQKAGCRISVATTYKAGPNVGDAELKTLLDPGFELALDLSNSRITDRGIGELAKFSKLYRLDLSGSQATFACLKELTGLKFLTVVLDAGQITRDSAQVPAGAAAPNCVLQINGMNEPAFHVLADARLLHLLSGAAKESFGRPESDDAVLTLNLESTALSDRAMKDVATLKNIKSLYLRGSAVTDAGLGELTELHKLWFVDLNSTNVTDAGLASLARLENLKSLDVRQTKITAAGLKRFTHHADLALALDDTVFDARTMQEIAQAGVPRWQLDFLHTDSSLHILHLAGMLHLLATVATRDENPPRSADDVISYRASSDKLTSDGFKELTAFKNLQILNLRYSGIDDAGLASLADLEHLTTVDLSHTKVTDAGLRLLVTRKSLSRLNVQRTFVTRAGIAELQSALPHCDIKQ